MSEKLESGQWPVASGQQGSSSLATDHRSLTTDEAIPPGARHDAPPARPVDDHTESRIERLRQAVAASNITQVAARCGISRPALSLILSGQYKAHPGRILDRFERYENGVDCPHLLVRLTDQQCRHYATAKRPSNPLGLQHYRACQQCPHRGGR